MEGTTSETYHYHHEWHGHAEKYRHKIPKDQYEPVQSATNMACAKRLKLKRQRLEG